MSYFYCDACHYCFSADALPDRCPDCGAVEHNDKPAVRPASKDEIDELLRIWAEGPWKECCTVFWTKHTAAKLLDSGV